MSVAAYEAEKVLQGLLEDHPELLAGSDMRPSSARTFVLVRREAPVPDHPDGAGRWSIDHLFLDQDAIPTLVEVKRSTDTRIRREVVGQMLDYAANGVRNWGHGQLRDMFEQTCKAVERRSDSTEIPNPTDPEDAIATLLGGNAESSAVDNYWRQAETNLRDGRIRLVFVADVIPEELRAIIEFLNERMADVEVFEVEVRRYSEEGGNECYVPRLIGATAVATRVKGLGPTLEEKFDAAGAEVRQARRKLEELAATLGLNVVQTAGSLQAHDEQGAVARVYPAYASIEFPLERLWAAGHSTEAEDVINRLRHLHPGKTITDKSPNIGCAQAVANWDDVVAIVTDLKRVRSE